MKTKKAVKECETGHMITINEKICIVATIDSRLLLVNNPISISQIDDLFFKSALNDIKSSLKKILDNERIKLSNQPQGQE
jgi:hypothetical protein